MWGVVWGRGGGIVRENEYSPGGGGTVCGGGIF